MEAVYRQRRLKIAELRRLTYKYPQYFTNPDGIITWAVQRANNRDNKFLDEKLEQLRSIDRRLDLEFMRIGQDKYLLLSR